MTDLGTFSGPLSRDARDLVHVPSHNPASAGGTFRRRRAGARRVLSVVVLMGLGATSAFQVEGYTLTMLAPICLFLAPAWLLTRPTVGQWLPLALALTGFAAFCISAQINGLSMVDERVQQWAAFAVYYLGILVLGGRDLLRCFSIYCGIAIGTVVYGMLPGSASAMFYRSLADVWKYGLGQWIVIIVLFAAVALKLALPLQALLLILIGAFSLAQDYRSLATNCLLAGVIVLVGWAAAARIPRWWQLAFAATSGLAVYMLLPRLAASGLLGTAIQRKTESQLDEGVPLILAGRTESPLSIAAIMERPWFGWASANNISAQVFDQAQRLAISVGFNPAVPLESGWYYANGDVSLHSILLGVWAEGGLFTALLPLGLFVAALMMIWNAPRYGRWAALVIVVSVQAIWDLLFSPWSYGLLAGLAVLAVAFSARHLPSTSTSIEGSLA
ncbi:hypothetical protein M1247_27425 [Mycobacterium sp. 21AC1]|uniref:hypothetical protein n=1 Tax=[Mycobacterium] appelbergii TaxID=2939269 RepID=UPI002938FCDE|nr:hypothetical protein [Mycobacterium sp. 21AC1]MDV3128665.1 hypothetical protein [Mycobacterium sp. 21AC1]